MAQIKKTAKLVRLSDTELTIANSAEDIRGHTVVDKYETAPGVLNRDILDVEDAAGFDLVVSISTL